MLDTVGTLSTKSLACIRVLCRLMMCLRVVKGAPLDQDRFPLLADGQSIGQLDDAGNTRARLKKSVPQCVLPRLAAS